MQSERIGQERKAGLRECRWVKRVSGVCGRSQNCVPPRAACQAGGDPRQARAPPAQLRIERQVTVAGFVAESSTRSLADGPPPAAMPSPRPGGHYEYPRMPACGHVNSNSRQSCKLCRRDLDRAADTGPDSVGAPVNGYSFDSSFRQEDSQSLRPAPVREGELAPPSTNREFDYIVVPFVGQIRRGFFNSQNAQDVSIQLQAVISERARQGWLFCSIEKIDIQVTPGCLAHCLARGAA